MATERARSKVGFLIRDDWQVGWNHEVGACTCVWHKVGVVDMESSIDLHESDQGRNHLPYETIQAGVGRRERSSDEELHSRQESRIKLKLSGPPGHRPVYSGYRPVCMLVDQAVAWARPVCKDFRPIYEALDRSVGL